MRLFAPLSVQIHLGWVHFTVVSRVLFYFVPPEKKAEVAIRKREWPKMDHFTPKMSFKTSYSHIDHRYINPFQNIVSLKLNGRLTQNSSNYFSALSQCSNLLLARLACVSTCGTGLVELILCTTHRSRFRRSTCCLRKKEKRNKKTCCPP